MSKIIIDRMPNGRSMLSPMISAFNMYQNNPEAYKSLLIQFLSSFETDNDNLSCLGRDSNFPVFLYQIYDIMTRNIFPSPSTEPISDHLVCILNFLTDITLKHPDVLAIVANFTPLDRIIPIFFKANIVDSHVVDPQPSHLLLPLQFLSAITQSSHIIISSTESMSILFIVLRDLFCVPQLSSYAMTVFSSISRNSQTALSYIESIPELMSLKREFASMLTSNDHNVIITALSCLSTLFSRTIDKETTMKVAFSAVITPPSLPVATSISAAIVLNLSEEQPLSSQEQEILIQTAMKSNGMRAYILFRLISEIASDSDSRIYQMFQQFEFFTKFFLSLLANKDCFVVSAGAQLLQMIFDDTPPVVATDSFEKPFMSSLRFIITSIRESELEKVESLLVALRVLIKSREALSHMVEIIQVNEDQIFLAYQRCIEANYSFASLNFFLFLYSCTSLFPHWLMRMREIAIDSQFPALLVQCLCSAQNRRVIGEALFALSIVNSGIKAKPPSIDVTLNDALASGFFFINRQNKQDKHVLDIQTKSMQDNYESKIRELENIIQTLSVEVKSLNEETLNSRNDYTFTQSRVEEVQNICEALQQKLDKKNKKIKIAAQELTNSNKEIQNLSLQVSRIHQSKRKADKKVEKLNGKLQSLKETESQYSQLHENMSATEEVVKELKLKMNDYEAEINELNKALTNEKQKKVNVDKSLGESLDRINQLSEQLEKLRVEHQEVTRLYEKNELIIKSKNTHEADLIEEIKKLRADLFSKEKQIGELRAENEHFSEINSLLRARVNNLKKEKKELVVVSQMIHKMTDGNLSDISQIQNFVSK